MRGDRGDGCLVAFGWRCGLEGVGGDAAGERDVGMDKEFEEVVEFVFEGVDGAGEGCGGGVGEA